MKLIKNKILYKDWIYEWLMRKKEYIKESTYANYSSNIFNHIIPSLGNYYLSDLNQKIIQDFILYLFKEGRKNNSKGLSEKTIKNIIIIIKGSLKEAMLEEKINYYQLTFKYPKQNRNSKIYILSKYEQNKITKYALNNLNNKTIGILISLYLGLSSKMGKY